MMASLRGVIFLFLIFSFFLLPEPKGWAAEKTELRGLLSQLSRGGPASLANGEKRFLALLDSLPPGSTRWRVREITEGVNRFQSALPKSSEQTKTARLLKNEADDLIRLLSDKQITTR